MRMPFTHRFIARTFAITILLSVVAPVLMRVRAQAPRPSISPPITALIEQGAARPRLVLLIVVDQFRYDYLERFGDLFVQGGLRRLLREGASWREANYDHMPTSTAPGHAT